ncbi:unnamed protein product [Lupinus luteus]|uniref:RNase H type-1 domain-containing protein n=1 Tax=Lupinus luteus TaxID=3873 RepID=A0AAV1WAK4_LUPLU
MMVSDCIDRNGVWSSEMIMDLVPKEIAAKIIGMHPPLNDESLDSVSWLGNSLPTNSLQFQSKMAPNSCCPRCGLEESILHSLRDCVFSRYVWMALSHSVSSSSFFNCSLEEWISSNLLNSSLAVGNVHWSLIFGIVVDAIWRCRNRLVFDRVMIDCVALCVEVSARSRCTTLAFRQLSNSVVHSENPNSSVIRWLPPDTDWVKLNTDGAVSQGNMVAGCGGVVRDHLGAFIFAYAKHVGFCSVTQAEFWGILHGLRLALQRGFLNVCLETNSASSVQLIQSGCNPPHSCAILVFQIRSLIPKLSTCIVLTSSMKLIMLLML